jgi:hypothetical protein
MPLRVLYVTDLTYQARGRRYCDEDIELSAALRQHFDIALCHPLSAEALMRSFDVLVMRNTGPVIHYRDAYERLRQRAMDTGVRVFTEMTGKGDQRGKQYLLDLFAAGFPVIPTVDTGRDIDLLPRTERYAVKPKFGADSIGLQFLTRDELATEAIGDMLIQPEIPFSHEVSFYFVDRTFQYALYAPDPKVRWGLEHYEPTDDDLKFAERFVDWNDIDHGIQRVDACRTRDGDLLLVELEDLNPYLSLDVVSPTQRASFVADMASSISRLGERVRGASVEGRGATPSALR